MYFTGEGVGEVGGSGGEPVVTPAAWCFLSVDDPDQHYELDAPPMSAEMSDAELVANHETALDAAQAAILEYLERAGRL